MPWPPGSHLFRKKGPSLFALFPSLFFLVLAPKMFQKGAFFVSKMGQKSDENWKRWKANPCIPSHEKPTFSGSQAAKTTPNYLSFSCPNFDPVFERNIFIFRSHFGTLDPPGTSFFGQNGVGEIGGKQFFSKVCSVVPLWAPKVTPRVAQGAPKAAPRSLFGRLWTTFGHFLSNFGHIWPHFWLLLLMFGNFSVSKHFLVIFAHFYHNLYRKWSLVDNSEFRFLLEAATPVFYNGDTHILRSGGQAECAKRLNNVSFL